MDVKLGIGLATGMFYHAPAGTALPTSLTTTLPSTWKHAGDVDNTGITLALNKSVNNLRNWANVIKRSVLTDHNETVQSPIMDTTEEAFKTVMGEKNVTKSGGVLKVNLSDGDLPEQEAFLWIMKDGDDMMAIGCSYGQITAVDNVAFSPGDAIKWTPTITAQGTNGFQLIMEEGATGATGAT